MSTVFLSYSRKIEAWKDRLKKHLGVLEAQGLLDIWDDQRIAAGAKWLQEIQNAMESASVAVLLISADFLISPFILSKEVPKLLERRSQEGLVVIPVLLHDCAWEQVAWLKAIQGRPRDGRPLASFKGERRNQELTKITKEILALLHLDSSADDLASGTKDDFLSRVEAVCRLREPEAEIQRYPSKKTGDYLRVIRRDGDFQDTYPVGAVEHGLSQDSLQVFLEEIDAPYRKTDSGLITRLVYGGEPASADLVARARAHRVRLVSFVEHQGLIDFRSYLTHQTAKLANDPIYPPRLYVPQRMRTLSILGREEAEAADALTQVREWLDAPISRFIVLLGDFGTGKTFLLQELARRMGDSEGGLVPILLQMRSLEKGRTLDALLAQHFAQEGMETFSPAKFRYMLEQGRIALLFDGFDELALRVTYAKAADHFATLLQAASGNAKVVLTSRRQHFLSESQVKTALAQQVETVSGHRLTILQPFEREQVHYFLVKFFQGDEEKAAARLDLIDRVKDLLGLSSNPRLLGFIAELPEEQLAAACAEGGEITAAKLYELLLDRWLVYEFDRVHPKGAPPGLSVEERWRAVTLVAMRLWQRTDRFVSLSDLSEEAARVVQAVGPSAHDSDVTTFQVGSGTLLVRNEEGNFAFLHQSILEWLVARSAAEALSASAHPEALSSREISPLMADFFASLAHRDRAIAWARGILSFPAGETAKKNALLVLERQKEKIHETLDLAGQDLRGRDYSGQDLSGADLSGADLTAARLIRTRLDRARLAKAIVRDADLCEADLTQADLVDSDFTGARLFGANLMGANLTRARLGRTKLLGAVLPDSGGRMANVFGAAFDLSNVTAHVRGAAGECRVVVWSPDGDLLANAVGSVIHLWEAQSGREIRTLTGHQDSIWSMAFSPDGKSLASGSSDNTVRLWQVESGCEIKILKGHLHWVRGVTFSPDGKSLASSSNDNTIRIWQLESGYESRVLRRHQNRVLGVAFSPNGRSLASTSYKTVHLWDIGNGRELQVFEGHQDWVLSVAFSPDGESLASGSSDKTVRLWKVDAASERRAFSGHRDRVLSVAFSPDGNTLASGSADTTVRLWKVDSRRESTVFQGQKPIWSAAFSPDGQSLASGSSDNTVRLWQVDSGREIRVFKGHQSSTNSIVFSPDGQSLANGSSDNTVRLWQMDSGREVRVFKGHQNPVFSVVFSPDNKSLVSSSSDNTLLLWQVDSDEIKIFSRFRTPIRSVAFSPDGKSLASGSDDNIVRLWQVDSRRQMRAFKGHQSPIWSVAFSPDGKSLASSSDDNTIRVWQLDSKRESRVFKGYQKPIRSVAFSPDGKSLAGGSDDNTIHLWKVDSGRESRVLKGHQNRVLTVAFSPDGNRLGSGSEDNTVRLWQVDNGREIRAFTGHQSSVLSLAFSPDGKNLASSSSDGTIRLWDIADGCCLTVLLPLPEGWVAYSPDGRYKFGGVPAGGFWHVVSLCRFEIGELDDWVPGLRLADDASFFDLPPWKPEVVVPERS